MKSPPLAALTLCLMLGSTTAFAAPSSSPLAEAATALANKLPKGSIVTAESHGNSPTYHITGQPDAPAANTPPESLLFEIGSISKVFTGLLLAQALIEKKLTLQTTLADLLSQDLLFKDPKIAAITLQQLATHTSGLPRLPSNLGPNPDTLPDPYSAYDRQALYDYLSNATLQGSPPFPAAYSNLGFGLLGDLLAKTYDTTWEKLVITRIAQPLGMTDTRINLTNEQTRRLPPPYNGQQSANNWTFQSLAGAGALRSTAADLITFGRALLQPQDTPFPEAIRLMLTPLHPFKDAGAQIGLGILNGQFMSAPCWDHDGGTGGYRSSFQIQPTTQTIRVVLVNNAAFTPQSLFAAIARSSVAAPVAEQPLTAPEAAAYAGVYELGPQSRFTVIARKDQLWVRLTGQPFFRVFRSTTDQFFYRAVEAQLHFTREGTAINGLTLLQNGRELHAARTPEAPPKLLFRPTAELKKYIGTYALAPGQTFTITLKGSTLYAQLTGQPALPVFKVRTDYFEYDAVQAALEFELKEDRVTALTLHQNGRHRAPRQTAP
jgi:D-alanyl-D-alanine-carboxypeptidase/D-alanyl-D-alanine-endopeptidase